MSKTLGNIVAAAATIALVSLGAASGASAGDRCEKGRHHHHHHRAHHHHHAERVKVVKVVAPMTRVHVVRERHAHHHHHHHAKVAKVVEVRAPHAHVRVARCVPCGR